MGIYGNILMNFQALFIDLTSFDMLPLVNSGFDRTKDRDEETAITTAFRGCFQNIAARETRNTGGNLTTVISGNLWSDTPLKIGNFVYNPEDLATYRIKRINPWTKEAGYSYYDVVQVTGDDGSLTVEPDFDLGEASLL
jgi:hypothetical protein